MKVEWLYILGFLSNSAAGILIPALPLYLQSLGAAVLIISVIIGVYGLLKTISLVYFSHLSDIRGRSAVMLLELSSLTAFSILLAFAHQPLLVFALAVPYGLAGNIPTIAAASVGDLGRGRNINVLMGGFMLSIGLGFAVGNYVGGYATAMWGFQYAFYIAAVFAFASIPIILFAMRDMRRYQDFLADHTPLYRRVRNLMRVPRIASTAVIAFADNIGLAMNFTFFPLLGIQFGLSPADIGIALAVRALSSTGVRGVIGYLVGVRPRGKILVVTPLFSGLAIALMWLADSFAVFLLLVAAEGISYGVYLTLGRAEVADAVRGDHVGMGLGFLDMFAFTSQMLFVIVLGGAAVYVGLRAIFPIGGFLMFAGAGLALFAQSRPKPSRAGTPDSGQLH